MATPEQKARQLIDVHFGHEFGLAQIGNGDVVEISVEGDEVSDPPAHYPLA